MYFESHAHYDDKRFNKDRESLLRRLPEKGIDFIVNSGADMESSYRGLVLTKKYDYIYASVGVHPHDAKSMVEENIEELRALSKFDKIVAIGEIGLDFHYDRSPRDTQRYWFKEQLKLSKEVNLPVIIHSREANQECFDIIKEHNVNEGVIHCYSGSAQMALDYIKMGFFIGIGGVITYPNAKSLVDVVKSIPLDNILIETDCPYLTPAPKRGSRNDSSNLFYVVDKIAELKGINHEDVANITKNNAEQLFFK